MDMQKKPTNSEGRILQYGIVGFWLLFWLFNVIDKFIGGSIFLWVGKDRLAQLVQYFTSIGIENPNAALGFLIFITVVQIIALSLLALTLWHLTLGTDSKAHRFFFWGTVAGLFMFTFFSIGDQIFGDRAELLEHTTFWMAILVSWGAYTYILKLQSKDIQS